MLEIGSFILEIKKIEKLNWHHEVQYRSFNFLGDTEQTLLDRNRLYGRIGCRFSQNIRTEIGLMNQSTISVSRNQFNLITFFKFFKMETLKFEIVDF
jgi:hypothetical protein